MQRYEVLSYSANKSANNEFLPIILLNSLSSEAEVNANSIETELSRKRWTTEALQDETCKQGKQKHVSRLNLFNPLP